AGLVKASEEDPTRKYDPWELVTEAVQRMKRNNDVMRSDRLKQVMQEIDSSFDEKNLGISKFSRFCQEAAQRGLLTVTKLENGQLEVDIPSTAAATESTTTARAERAAPAAETAEPLAAGDERGRRGRRGRGGRGRDREREPREPREARASTAAAFPVIETPVGETPAAETQTGAVSEAPIQRDVPRQPVAESAPEPMASRSSQD